MIANAANGIEPIESHTLCDIDTPRANLHSIRIEKLHLSVAPTHTHECVAVARSTHPNIQPFDDA